MARLPRPPRTIAVIAAIAVCSTAAVSARTSGTAALSKQQAPRYRYIFGSGSAASAAASAGWNLIDVDSKTEADRLPSGARALLWLGDYDNSTCAWELSEAELRAELASMAGDPKVAGYFFSDEPDPKACPAAPAQHRSRSELIHRLNRAKFTVMVVDSNSGRASLDQIPTWRGAADYVGLNPYPCYHGKPCDYAWIRQIISVANRAGLRYWGVVQAFADSEWRWPTASEEARMLSIWKTSRQSGYMTFAWSWAGHSLRGRPGLLDVLRRFNRPTAKRRLQASTVDEVHYTFTGPTSVAFDWRGTAQTIRYGRTSSYGRTRRARAVRPIPFSSRGPFWEVRLGGLAAGTTYHYSIGGRRDRTFATAPTGSYRFDVEADVGDSASWRQVASTQAQIAADKPAFVIVAGDLSYGDDEGQPAVDHHFNDVMAWSQRAAYMPAWGNHEWDAPDDLRNYKGRFLIPHGQASPTAPSKGCCGEDWGWFDAGPVRFISYPEPYTDSTWSAWAAKADRLFAAAQASPRIHFIVTFGHRPAFSTGYHAGESALAAVLNRFGDRYSKYVLNLNGHSHNYERFVPIHRVVHITAAGGGSELEAPWRTKDSRTAYRAMHLEHLRVGVTSGRLSIEAVCGPASEEDEMTCRAGTVIDSYTITAPDS
jgi:hypothetical protein